MLARAEQAPDLLAPGRDRGLVLGTRTLGRQPLRFRRTLAVPRRLFLAAAAPSRDARSQLGNEGPGGGTLDEAAQVPERAAAHRSHLQATGELVEQCLGLIGTGAEQQLRRYPLVGDQLVGEDQPTTTGRHGARMYERCSGWWWFYINTTTTTYI